MRRERPDDPDLIALLTERETYLQGLYPERTARRRSVEAQADELAFYGLRKGGRLVGCGCLLRHPGFLELKKLFIAEAARAQGLGREMVAGLEAEARAAGYSLIKLEVGTRQAPAHGLYRKLGYVECSPFPPYRADPLSCFMEKRLAP